MKNISKIILITFLSITLSACSDDDDNDTFSINGTSWEQVSDNTTTTITFTSEEYYHYKSVGYLGGDDIKGTYTFSGKNGVLTDSYGTTEFYINGNTLTIDYSKGTGEYAGDTGVEVFSKKN